MSETKASVIVVAPDLNDYGRRCIRSLLALNEDVEVIFVPDEPPEGLDPRVVCVPSGPGVTTGHKRQLALERSSGDPVALIDDDAYPAPGWLAAARARLDADPELGAVCGPTLTPPDDTELEELGGRVYASVLVSGPARWRYAVVAERDVDDAPSVNLILRRSDAEAVGLESGDRWGEDSLVCDRLRRRGRRIRYAPDAVVYHSRRPLWRPHLRQLWRWSRHRSAYARASGGNSRRPAYFAPSALLVFALIGALLRGRPLVAWRAAMALYCVAVLVAGFDRSPARWARVSGAIAATHAVYGSGFLLGLAGLDPPRE